jgi:hypothetical protein
MKQVKKETKKIVTVEVKSKDIYGSTKEVAQPSKTMNFYDDVAPNKNPSNEASKETNVPLPVSSTPSLTSLDASVAWADLVE